MSIFTPFPIAMSMLVYGRSRGLFLAATCLLIVGFLGLKVFGSPFIIGVYLFSCLMAAAVTEILYRNMHPVRGLVTAGSSVLIIIGGFIVASIAGIEGSLREHVLNYVKTQIPLIRQRIDEIISKGGEVAIDQFNHWTQPELITDQILFTVPRYLFTSIFFWIWVILLLVLKGQRLFVLNYQYRYSDKDLLRFKVPDNVIWLVIGALGYTLFANEYLDVYASEVGISLLYALGVFYFFQGFGVYSDFLDYIKITGFIRSFLVIFTVVTANKFLALVGLFDLWVNFRKFFKNKEEDNKGDKL
jgi:hypothetical protein